MTFTHFYLRHAGEPDPLRWREAFPSGGVIEPAALPPHGGAADARTVWIGAADGAWPQRLQGLLAAQGGERVVVLSSTPEDGEALRALDLGARGYAHACATPALLHEMALVIEHGGFWVGPNLMRRLLHGAALALAPVGSPAGGDEGDGPWSLLSARESEVVHAVLAGRSNKEVAALLGISERTVKAHLGAVFEKLGVRDRLQLVVRLAGAGTEGASLAAAA